MGQLTTMFYAGILTPTLCTVLVFLIFLVCWFKCNLREKVNAFLDGRKTSKKDMNDTTIVPNAHFHNYTTKTRRDNESLEGSECDSAFDSLHDASTDEFPGSRTGSQGSRRSSPAISQTQTQTQASVGPVVDLLWEVSETGDYSKSHSDYTRGKTVRTISCDTIDNNLDLQKRMSKVQSKDLISSLAAPAVCQTGSGAYLVQSPTDNTLVGLSIAENYQFVDGLPALVHKETNSNMYAHRHGDYNTRDYQQHRNGPSEYLAAISMDSTEI